MAIAPGDGPHGPSQSQVFSACFFMLGIFMLVRAKPVTFGSVFLAACVSMSAAVMWNGIEPSGLPSWPVGAEGEGESGKTFSVDGLARHMYGFVRDKLEL